MRKIDKVSVHISVSTWGNVNAIRSWHLDRGWSDCGYNYVIQNGKPRYDSGYMKSLDGSIEEGRPVTKTPAAVSGHNTGMIAICMIGKDGKFTPNQLMSCIKLCSDLMDEYNLPLEAIKGHYEYEGVHKKCPEIDMNTMRLAIKSYREGN